MYDPLPVDPLDALLRTPPGVDVAPIDPLNEFLDRLRPPFADRAACVDPPEGVTWFPGPGQDHRPAIAICETCVVVDECQAYAVNEGLDGIWGGLTTRARRLSDAGSAAA